MFPASSRVEMRKINPRQNLRVCIHSANSVPKLPE